MARHPSKRTPTRSPKARAEDHDSLARTEPDSGRSTQSGAKKNSKEVKKLIDLGKEKGYLTYDDVNDMLPSESYRRIKSTDVMSIFGEMETKCRFQRARHPRTSAS